MMKRWPRIFSPASGHSFIELAIHKIVSFYRQWELAEGERYEIIEGAAYAMYQFSS
jgi:hypothetical protein